MKPSNLLLLSLSTLLLFNTFFLPSGQALENAKDSFLNYDYNYRAKKDFLDQMIKISEDLFVPSYTLALALPPYGLIQYGIGGIFRAMGVQKRVMGKNELRNHLSLEKLEILRPLVTPSMMKSSEEERQEATRRLFWLWRSMRGEGNKIISTESKIKKDISAEDIRNHILRFLSEHKLSCTDSKTTEDIIKAFSESFGFVSLRDARDEDQLGVTKALIKHKYLSPRLRAKKGLNKVSSQEILSVLKAESSTDKNAQTRILHDLGLISPSDLTEIFPLFPKVDKKIINKYLTSKRFNSDMEIQLALDALYLHNLGKKLLATDDINADNIITLKLKLTEERQLKKEFGAKYHIIHLEKEIMETKKNIIALFHNKEINNRYLQVKTIGAEDVVGTSLFYLSGMGVTTTGILDLVKNYAALSTLATEGVSIAAAAGLGVTGGAKVLIGLIGLSQNIPNYLEAKASKKVLAKLRAHLYAATLAAGPDISDEERGQLLLKTFETETALFEEGQLQKMYLNRIGFDSVVVGVGAFALTTAGFAIMSAVEVAAVAGATTPVSLACELAILTAALPIMYFTIDHLKKTKNLKLSRELKNILEKSLKSKLEDKKYEDEINQFMAELKSKPKMLLQLGVAKRALEKSRAHLADKKYASASRRFISTRFDYLVEEVSSDKAKMYKKSKKLGDTLEEGGRYQEVINNNQVRGLSFKIDSYDSFELLPSDQKATRAALDPSLALPRPTWMTDRKNDYNLAASAMIIMDAYANLHQDAIDLLNYREDCQAIKDYALQCPEKKIKKSYKKIKKSIENHWETAAMYNRYLRDHLKSGILFGITREEMDELYKEIDLMSANIIKHPSHFKLSDPQYAMIYAMLSLYVPATLL